MQCYNDSGAKHLRGGNIFSFEVKKMSGLWDALDKVSNILDEIGETMDDAKDAVNTTNYSIDKVQSSKGNLDRVLKRIESGENERDRKLAEIYERKGNVWIYWTIAICVISIIATILICIFV